MPIIHVSFSQVFLFCFLVVVGGGGGAEGEGGGVWQIPVGFSRGKLASVDRRLIP